jgi:bile acid:Na+ symporter, BASS family
LLHSLSYRRSLPVWVALCAVCAALFPPSFLWFQPDYIVIVLSLIMGGMGLTLSLDDFAVALSRPWVVLLGVLAQYSIMPSLGFLLGRVSKLQPELAVGLILVAVCPGGAASNLVCLIGKADVALSVVLTLCSTVSFCAPATLSPQPPVSPVARATPTYSDLVLPFLPIGIASRQMMSVLAIPVLMKVLAGSIVDIHAIPLLVSTSQVVLLPLIGGFALKRVAPGLVQRVSNVLPLASVVGVTLICGSIVARTSLTTIGPSLVIGIALLHALGGLLGFFAARLFRLPTKSCRTVSIEVMMQNSSLAVTLALAHFSSPLVAVPGAISATMHSVMGSILSGVWRWLDRREAATSGDAAAAESGT